MTTPKTPTPQGISALLKRAGFKRSENQGRNRESSGFSVSRDHGTGNVRVQHVTWSMNPPEHVTRDALAGYAETITEAGYTVLNPSPRWLLVTAKED